MSAADTARRLIAKNGRHDGRIERPSTLEAPVSSDQPWKPAPLAQTAEELDGILEALGALSGDGTPGFDGDPFDVVVLEASLFRRDALTPETTAVAYMAADALSSPPHVGDRLLTRGMRYHVISVEDLAPGEETFLFTLHLKG